MLNDKERIEFVKFCYSTGFIIPNIVDRSENKKLSLIKKYIRKGYRIVEYKEYNEFKVINIFEKYDNRIVKNVEKLYLDMFDNFNKKTKGDKK